MPKRAWLTQYDHPNALSVWPVGSIPSVPSGGGGGGAAQETRSMTYGWVYGDTTYLNSWREGKGTGLPLGYNQGFGYTLTLDLENDPTHTTASARWANIRAVYGSAMGVTYTSGFGPYKIFNPSPWPLDEYEWLVFAARAPAASTPIVVWVGDAGGLRLGDFKTITPKHDSLEGFGGMRHHAIHFEDDLGLTRPFPNIQTLTFENGLSTATGQHSIDEVRFMRALPRDMGWISVGTYAENRPAPGQDPANRGGVFGGHSVPGGAWSCGNTPFNYVPAISPRPTNIWAPGQKSADAGFKPYADLIGVDPATGNPFLPRGTTREILEFLSKKWGFWPGYTDPFGNGPPSLTSGASNMIQGDQNAITLGLNFGELPHAHAAKETGWLQHFQSDPTRSPNWSAAELASWGLPSNGWFFDSNGIGQQRWSYFQEHKESYLATAWGAELKVARIKAACNGDIASVAAIAGNIRKLLTWYFSGSTNPSENHPYACRVLGGTTDVAGEGVPIGTVFNGIVNDRDWTDVDGSGNLDWPIWNPNGSY